MALKFYLKIEQDTIRYNTIQNDMKQYKTIRKDTKWCEKKLKVGLVDGTICSLGRSWKSVIVDRYCLFEKDLLVLCFIYYNQVEILQNNIVINSFCCYSHHTLHLLRSLLLGLICMNKKCIFRFPTTTHCWDCLTILIFQYLLFSFEFCTLVSFVSLVSVGPCENGI